MKNVMKVLEKLDEHNMHVHTIDHELGAMPFHVTPIDTHFIMQGNEIVFHGSLTGLESFVLNLPRRVKKK